MFLADVAAILDSVLNFPLVLDILLVLFLLISTSFGFAKGFWRGTWRLISVVIMLVISWFFLIEPVALWVKDEMLTVFNISVTLGETQIKSFGEVLNQVIKMGVESGKLVDPKYADEVFVSGLILSICKSLAWLLLVIIIQFASWIISSLFYLLLIRLIIPKRVRAVKLKLLGALMSLVQAVIITFSMMISFSSLSPAIAQIDKSVSDAFDWANDYIIIVFKAFNPENSRILSPYIDTVDSKFGNDLHDFTYGENTCSGIDEIKEFFTLVGGAAKAEEPDTPDVPEDNNPSAGETPIDSGQTEENPVGLYHPFIPYFTFD